MLPGDAVANQGPSATRARVGSSDQERSDDLPEADRADGPVPKTPPTTGEGYSQEAGPLLTGQPDESGNAHDLKFKP